MEQIWVIRCSDGANEIESTHKSFLIRECGTMSNGKVIVDYSKFQSSNTKHKSKSNYTKYAPEERCPIFGDVNFVSRNMCLKHTPQMAKFTCYCIIIHIFWKILVTKISQGYHFSNFCQLWRPKFIGVNSFTPNSFSTFSWETYSNQ